MANKIGYAAKVLCMYMLQLKFNYHIQILAATINLFFVCNSFCRGFTLYIKLII